MSKISISSSKSALSTTLAEHVKNLSRSSITSRGKFTVALSGGSLPSALFAGLSEAGSVDWSCWHVFFADERCVSLGDEESNFRGAEAGLKYVPRNQIHTISEDLIQEPEKAAVAYETTMREVLGPEMSMDLVLLGIGPDGHTCSLFPDHALLNESERFVRGIVDSPKPPSKRITFTFKVLAAARNVAFVVTGEGKNETVRRILEDKDMELPATRGKFCRFN